MISNFKYMIYDFISNEIEDLCVDSGIIPSGSMLYVDEMPDFNLTSFVRMNWLYGNDARYTNKGDYERSTLVLEFFERTDESYNTIEESALSARNVIMKNLNILTSNDETAHLLSCSPIRLQEEDEWRRFNLNVNFEVWR